MKESLKNYIVLLVFGCLIAGLVVYNNRELGHHILHMLSDGFFVAGVLIFGCGVIGFAGTKGTFDMMGYGIKVAVNTTFSWMIPADSDFGKKESFVEYKERKDSQRKPSGPMLKAGATLLAVAIVFYVIYRVVFA